MSTSRSSAARDSYHHGDLAAALVRASVDLATAGGPQAVVLREAARRVGVSPTAAYRHFAGQEDLLDAVREVASTALAERLSRASAEAGDGRIGGPTDQVAPVIAAATVHHSTAGPALRRLVGLAWGYAAFSRESAGLFECIGVGLPKDPAEFQENSAYLILRNALADLVRQRVVPADRLERGADVVAWSAVHGWAMLCRYGPLGAFAPAIQDRLLDEILATVLRGLVALDR